MQRCQTPHHPLDSDPLAGNALRSFYKIEDKNPQRIDCRIFDYFSMLVKLSKRSFLRKNTEKNWRFLESPVLNRRFWAIAKSPESDALPGDKKVIVRPRADQSSFG